MYLLSIDFLLCHDLRSEGILSVSLAKAFSKDEFSMMDDRDTHPRDAVLIASQFEVDL